MLVVDCHASTECACADNSAHMAPSQGNAARLSSAIGHRTVDNYAPVTQPAVRRIKMSAEEPQAHVLESAGPELFTPSGGDAAVPPPDT
ncbi:UNVERIFIED_ORG: ribosomal protein S27E [Arthrobacter globiformis]|nr:ribosomal protein S27E [Arthrobacter globiformis]